MIKVIGHYIFGRSTDYSLFEVILICFAVLAAGDGFYLVWALLVAIASISAIIRDRSQ